MSDGRGRGERQCAECLSLGDCAGIARWRSIASASGWVGLTIVEFWRSVTQAQDAGRSKECLKKLHAEELV